MNDQLIKLDKNDSRWIITLNRPEKRNALSDELVTTLRETVEQARVLDIPTLVFQAEGRNFSAGFDFSDFDSVSRADLLWRFVRIQELFSAILAYPGLTIGIAHGRNFGAGCDLFASCDVRLASPDARFRMPGVLFDLVLGTRRFGELVGSSHANRILLSQSEFDSEEGLRIGFVTQIWAPGHDTDAEDADAVAQPQAAKSVYSNASLESIITATARLSSPVRHALTDTLSTDTAYQDMGRLVESVMHGDIKERLARYLNK